MFNRYRYDNSRDQGVATLEIAPTPADDAQSGRVDGIGGYLPLARTDLRGRIFGPLAHLTITHTFRHPVDRHGPVLEAVYRFPLPGDAAVTGARVWFGDVEISAELEERRQAEQNYDEARAAGRQAALLTRESPDVFTLHVAGIESGEDVVVETTCIQLARAERNGFGLRAPLTPAPRYSGHHEFGSRHADGQPLALARDPGHRFSMDITILDAAAISSATHDLAVDVSGNETRVSLRSGEVVPDRDLVLSWQPDAHKDRPALQVWRHRERFDVSDIEPTDGARSDVDAEWPDSADYDYFLALVSPPESPPAGDRIPREVIVLVDRSGSMSGPKWEAADWAVNRFLKTLDGNDRFNLGLFHSTTRWFSRATLPATDHRVADARHFLRRHTDSGGTALGTALDQALKTERSTGNFARHILVITDAQVSDIGGILALAKQESGQTGRRRISVLCIDAAPNSHLVHELVEVGGGRAAFLTSDPEQDDITTALDDVMDWWDAPASTGLALTVNRAGAWVMGRAVRDEAVEVHTQGARAGVTRHTLSRIDLGDLPFGRPIWVVGRAPAGDDADLQLTFQLRDAGNDAIATLTVNDDPEPTGYQAIKSLFGSRRLPQIENKIHRGYSHSMDRRERSPRLDRAGRERLRKLLVAESLHYGLVSSETAFVAVRKEAGRVVERGAIVPNALPAGWDDELWLSSAAVAYAPARLAVPPDFSVFDFEADIAQDIVEDAPSMSREIDARELYPNIGTNQRAGRLRRRSGVPRLAESLQPHSGGAGRSTLFDGVPPGSREVIVLYEDSRPDDAPPDRPLMLTGIEIAVQDEGEFDGTLSLDVGDGSRPRATMRISDVLALGGNRPLNVLTRPGENLRLILSDVTTGGDMPRISVTVYWRVA